MIRFRHFGAFVLALFVGSAIAAEPRPYSRPEFDHLMQIGAPILVDVAATWCPTCRAQHPLIERLSIDPAYSKVVVLTVDFDDDKDALAALRVSRQSTLIAFRAGKEVARSIGDTSQAGIEQLFRKAAE